MRYLGALFAIAGMVLLVQGLVLLRYGRDLIPQLQIGSGGDRDVRLIAVAFGLFVLAALMNYSRQRRD